MIRRAGAQSGDIGAAKHLKLVYLPKDLLDKLYARFALANPKGTVIVAGSQYEDYAPPDLTEAEKDRLYEEGKPTDRGDRGLRRDIPPSRKSRG
jgi:hypothetical protein